MSGRSAIDTVCDVPSPEERLHAGSLVRRGAKRFLMVRPDVRRRLLSAWVVVTVIAGMAARLQADGAGDNDPKNVRRLPDRKSTRLNSSHT